LRHQQKESLPYQNPMLDHMSGLRRVTLNGNPLIADRGATFLAEVIEADLWIKGKSFLCLTLSLIDAILGSKTGLS
jgi:hypothetical protein